MELSSSPVRKGSRIKKLDLKGKEIMKGREKEVKQEGHAAAPREADSLWTEGQT